MYPCTLRATYQQRRRGRRFSQSLPRGSNPVRGQGTLTAIQAWPGRGEGSSLKNKSLPESLGGKNSKRMLPSPEPEQASCRRDAHTTASSLLITAIRKHTSRAYLRNAQGRTGSFRFAGAILSGVLGGNGVWFNPPPSDGGVCACAAASQKPAARPRNTLFWGPRKAAP